ncbi:MAG: LysM peptidoglycan-binding domain-containing protein [Marinilabiliales bacterium]
MHLKFVIISLFFLFIGQYAYNQKDITKSTEIVSIKGKKYYLHEVKKGQTVYSICKAYNVSQSDIAIENPEIFDGLKEGQILKIPYYEDNKDGKFIFHVVKKGETIYYITRKYGISEDNLLKYNPVLNNGLKAGQTLKIKKKDIKTSKEIQINEDVNYYYHKVEKKQTLYSLSKTYNVSQKDIINANPQISERGLQYNEIIRIPKIKKQYEINVNDTINTVKDTLITEKDTINLTDTLLNPCLYDYNKNPERFKIALLLPLYKDGISIYQELEEVEIKELTQKPFYEFYEGFLLAVEKYQQKGLMIDLYVYDTKKDTSVVSKILKDTVFNSMDLIIGPVYQQTLKIVVDKLKPYNIPVVSPYNTDISILNSYNNYFQVAPSFESQVECAVDYMSESIIPNFVIIHDNKEEAIDFVNYYKNKLQEKLLANDKNDKVKIQTVNFKIHGVTGIINALQKDTTNLVIIPSSDQVFVSEVLTKIYVKTHKDYDITLAGFPSWMKYENLSMSYFHDFKFTTFTHQFVDYYDSKVLNFLENFRDTYKGEPSKYSFTGYDIGDYFLSTLFNYGPGFYNCMDSIKTYNGLQTIFCFKKNNPDSGFENTGTFIIRYDKDYDIRKLFPLINETDDDQ